MSPTRNVILGQAVFTVDFRCPDEAVLRAMEAKLQEDAKQICDEMGLDISLKSVGGFDLATFDAGCVGALRNAAQNLGYSHKDIV